MELVAEILPVLVALYVVDSALIVRSGQLLFVAGWGGRFEARGPGLRLPGLLPFAEAVLGARLPLRANDTGVWIPGGRAGDRLVPYDAMQDVTADAGLVRLGRGLELPVRPRALAPQVARVVERLRRTPRGRRLARLRRELRPRVDPRALAALRARAARRLPALRLASGLCFLAIFGLLPLSLVPELPRRPSPTVSLLLVLALYLATLGLSARLLRECGVRGGRLFGALLPLFLFPPAAAHAPSIVLRELYLGFEPLALARSLLPAGGLDRLDLALEPSPPESANPAWSVEALVRDLAGKARGAEAEPAAPVQRDAAARSFCPRCRAGYRADFSRCSDCDVALVPFAPVAGDGAAS